MTYPNESFAPTGCEFIIGSTLHGYLFCGDKLETNKNTCYCEVHRKIAYVTPSETDEIMLDSEIIAILQHEGEYIDDEMDV